jgi:hypothetical protein
VLSLSGVGVTLGNRRLFSDVSLRFPPAAVSRWWGATAWARPR